MRISGRIWNRVLVRYLLSYFAVLIIPLLAFSLLHEKYFILLYRDGIIRQNSLALDNTCTQLGMYFSEMEAIAVQFSRNEMLGASSLRDDAPRYSKVRSALNGVLGAKPFFSYITFYSPHTPGIIFTANGTFSPHYYRKIREGGEYMDLNDYLKSLDSARWFFPDETPEGEIVRIIPIPVNEGSFLLLDLDVPSVRSLVESADCLTAVFDAAGVLVYPRNELDASLLGELSNLGGEEPFTRISGDRYALVSADQASGVRCVRVMSDEIILQSVKELQKQYGSVLLVLALAGGLLIYLFSFLSYKPIRDLDALAGSSVSGIPEHLHGAAKVGFAIRKMEERYHSLKKDTMREKLILRAINGNLSGYEDWNRVCEAAGIDIYADEYRVALLLLGKAGVVAEPDIERVVWQILGEEISCQIVEYPDEMCYLLLLGYGADAAGVLYDKLRVIAQELPGDGEDAVKIAVGNGCGSVREIAASYMQAVLASKSSPPQYDDKVLLYERLINVRIGYVYPKMELDALYSALLNADVERIRLMTDILTDLVRSRDIGEFMRTSLCFDIIKSYTRAQEELQEDVRLQGYPEISQIGSQLDASDPDTLIVVIENMCRRTIQAMQDNGGGIKPEDDKSPSKILQYIDDNWQDDELSVSSVAEYFSLSLSNLSHRFKAQTGLNISGYISEKKILYAKELLVTTNLTLSNISEKVGYKQTTSFIRKFKQIEKMTPSEYRETFENRSKISYDGDIVN